MVLHPATEGGIRFRRVDVTDRDNVIPARFDLVADTTLCTLLRNEAGVTLGTVEHIMAAFAGTGVTHALVDIDGPEVPIMDGSSRRFVQAILRVGLRALPGDRVAIRVLKPVREGEGEVCGRAPARRDALDRLRDRLRRRRHRPSGAPARHGQRRLRARTGRLPHLLPPRRGGDDAGEGPGTRRLARQRHRGRGREGAEPRRPAPLRRVRAPQDARRPRRPRARRRADPRRLQERQGRARRHQPPPAQALRHAGAFEIVTLDAEAAAQLPGAGVGTADLRRAG